MKQALIYWLSIALCFAALFYYANGSKPGTERSSVVTKKYIFDPIIYGSSNDPEATLELADGSRIIWEDSGWWPLSDDFWDTNIGDTVIYADRRKGGIKIISVRMP